MILAENEEKTEQQHTIIDLKPLEKLLPPGAKNEILETVDSIPAIEIISMSNLNMAEESVVDKL